MQDPKTKKGCTWGVYSNKNLRTCRKLIVIVIIIAVVVLITDNGAYAEASAIVGSFLY